jgi:hypothetical protein
MCEDQVDNVKNRDTGVEEGVANKLELGAGVVR